MKANHLGDKCHHIAGHLSAQLGDPCFDRMLAHVNVVIDPITALALKPRNVFSAQSKSWRLSGPRHCQNGLA